MAESKTGPIIFQCKQEIPNMFAKFGIEFLTQVIKRSFVVCESSLEGVFSKSHVGLIRPVVLRRDSRLVHH